MSTSTSHLVGYRLELRAPRDLQSDPVTEPDVLTPRAGALHSDAFRLTTLPGDGWGRGYLGLPSGRRGTLDLRTRKVDIGGVGLTMLDPRLADDDAERWLAQFLGDANGNPQLAAQLRALLWETRDGGCSWERYFTGRTTEASKPSPPEWALQLTDMAAELQRDVFVGHPHASVTYARVASLLPYGLRAAWNGFPATAPILPGIKATAADGLGQVRVRGSNFIDRYVILQEDLRARGTVTGLGAPTRLDGTDPSFTLSYEGERVKVRLRNPDTAAEGWFWLRRLTVQRNVEDHYVARQIYVEPLDPAAVGYATWASLGADGSDLEYELTPGDGLSESGALLIDRVHPVTLLKDLIDGKFGYLDLDGSVRRQVPRDTTDPVWDELEADDSFGRVAFIVPGPARLDQWVQEKICKPFGLAYYFNPEGYFTPLDVRRPEAYLTLPELTDADVIGAPGAEAWSQNAAGAITRVGVTWREDTAMNVVKEVVQSGASIPAVPAGLIRQTPQRIYDPPLLSQDPRTRVGRRFGDKVFEVDAEGLRGKASFVFLDRRSTALPQALAIARETMTPYASGERVVTLRCRRTAVVLATTIGAPRLVSVSTLPDPVTNRYGETRLMRCVGVQEQGVAVTIKFADLGLASVADPPTIGEPSTGGAPVEAGTVDATVTRNGVGDPAEIWANLTDPSVAARPAESDPGWFKATDGVVDGVYRFGPFPGGGRAWVRARSVPGLYGDQGGELRQPSAWAYPSDDGTSLDYVDLPLLAGLSNLQATNVTAAGADLTWEGGDDTAIVEVLVDAGSVTPTTVVASPTNFHRFFRLQTLEPGTLCTAGVRLRDATGAPGALLTVEFTTAGGTLTLDRPAGIDFIYWSSIEGRVFASSSYPIELSRAPELGGGGVDEANAENVALGPDGTFYDALPADQSLYYYRARHVPGSTSGSGVVASEWTEWLPAVARGTQSDGGGGGGSGNGDLPTDEQPSAGTAPATLPPVLPTVDIGRAEDGSTGTVTVTVTDPQGRLQRVEFQTQVGAAAPSAWAEDASAPYEGSVGYTAAEVSVVRWRVIGFDAQNRPGQVLLAGEVRFGGVPPGDAEFVLTSASSGLPNSRVLTDTTEIAKDTATAGQVKLNIVTLAVSKLTGILAAAKGGTGLDGSLNAVGDLLIGAAAGWARLIGNTTTTRKFLRQVGTGSASNDPAWDTLQESDLPREAWAALADGATITWAVAGKREAKAYVTLGGNRTLDITGLVDGSSGILEVTQDGTGGRGLNAPAGSKIEGVSGVAFPLSTGAGKIDVLAFEQKGTPGGGGYLLWTIGKAFGG